MAGHILIPEEHREREGEEKQDNLSKWEREK